MKSQIQLIMSLTNLSESRSFLNSVKHLKLASYPRPQPDWTPRLLLLLLLKIYLPLTKKFYIALDKANWSQPKMEKSYIYIKA